MAYEQLLAIIEEAAEIDRQDQTGPPVVCPYDLTTLKEGPNGVLFCPWAGDYTWPDDGFVA